MRMPALSLVPGLVLSLAAGAALAQKTQLLVYTALETDQLKAYQDMSEPYSRELVALAERVALEQGVALQRAVFVAVPGPSLETAAEYRFLRWAGADVVGMSLVPETIAAVHGGQRVLALNVVTDTCLPDHLHPVDIPAILAVAGRMAPTLIRLVTEVVRRLEDAR